MGKKWALHHDKNLVLTSKINPKNPFLCQKLTKNLIKNRDLYNF